VSVVANVAVNLDARGVTAKLAAIRQGSIGAADGFKNLQARAQAVKSIVEAQQGSFAKASTVQGVFAAKVKNTELAIKAQIAALRDVQSKVQFNGALYQKAGQQIKQYEAVLRSANAETQRAAGKFNGLRTSLAGISSAFGGLAAVFGAIQAGRFVFAKTAEVESQTRSLQVLTGSAEKAGQIIKELQDLGAITPFTSTELIDAAKRLQAFGVEADKVVETTRRLADASGATGAELSGLVTAYGQVQAKGRLQGEELLQFQERGIALQEELRKMYGMTGEEFQKALSKGQFSAKAVEVALENLTNTGGKYANGAIAQSDTLSGRLSTLQDNVDGVAREVGKVLTPALIGMLQQLNTSLSQTPAFVEDIALAFQYAAGQIAPFLNGLSQMQWFFTNLTPPGWAMQVIGGAAERGKSTIRGAASRQRQSQKKSFIGPAAPQMQGPAVPKRLSQKPNNLPPPLMIPSSTVGGGGRARGGGVDKAARNAKRAAEQAAQAEKQIQERLRGLTREIELTSQIGTIKNLQFQAEMDGNKELQARLQGEERIIQIMQSTAQALDGITDQRLQQKILAKAEGEILIARQDTALEMQRIEAERTKSFDEIIAGLDLELALKSATTEQAREQLRLEAEIAKLSGQGFTREQTDAIKGKKTELAKPKEESQKIEERLGKVKNELKELTSLSNQVTKGAEAIGGAFQQAFMGLVSGSMTAKEALASFFKSVADHFLDMASQMIAKMIEMFILQTVLGIIGGAAGSGGGGGNYSSAFKSAPKTSFKGALAMPKLMAEGGFVTGPTSAVIGEGGESEYVIPASKMQSAMARYSRGARGESVIAGNGGNSEGGTATAAAGPMVVDVRYNVERINEVEYVTASQFQAGMRQAAQQGAAQGEQRTLRRLQQSPGTRKRVGM